MTPGHKRRLARLLAADRAKRTERLTGPAIHRSLLRFQVELLTILRTHFPPEDAGPALDHALAVWGRTEAELAAIPDSKELRAADAALAASVPVAGAGLGAAKPQAKAKGPPKNLLGMIGHIIEDYVNGAPFNRTSASPMECIAWCFACAASRFSVGRDTRTGALPFDGESGGPAGITKPGQDVETDSGPLRRRVDRGGGANYGAPLFDG